MGYISQLIQTILCHTDCMHVKNNIQSTPLQQNWTCISFDDHWFAKHCRISNVRTKGF